MALNFNLFMATSKEEVVTADIVRLLRDVTVDDATASQGMIVEVGSVIPPVLSEILGFQPGVWVSYQPDPNYPQFKQNEDRMVESALSLAEHWNAEATFVFELDKVIFRRRDGVIVLNSDGPLGRALEWNRRLTVPHVLESLPGL